MDKHYPNIPFMNYEQYTSGFQVQHLTHSALFPLLDLFFFFPVYEVTRSTTEDTLGLLRVFENGLKACSNDSGVENMWRGFSNKKVKSAGFQRHALK